MSHDFRVGNTFKAINDFKRDNETDQWKDSATKNSRLVGTKEGGGSELVWHSKFVDLLRKVLNSGNSGDLAEFITEGRAAEADSKLTDPSKEGDPLAGGLSSEKSDDDPYKRMYNILVKEGLGSDSLDNPKLLESEAKHKTPEQGILAESQALLVKDSTGRASSFGVQKGPLAELYVLTSWIHNESKIINLKFSSFVENVNKHINFGYGVSVDIGMDANYGNRVLAYNNTLYSLINDYKEFMRHRDNTLQISLSGANVASLQDAIEDLKNKKNKFMNQLLRATKELDANYNENIISTSRNQSMDKSFMFVLNNNKPKFFLHLSKMI